MRIVFDTNVLIAAFITEGFCTSLLHYTAKHHELISSSELLDEFEGKLESKFDFTRSEIEFIRSTLKPILQLVEPESLASQVSRDIDDDIVLGTALAGSCSYIVSGDKDLLVLKEYQGVLIVKPREFWERTK